MKTLHSRWLIFWILALQYLFVYFHRVCPAVVAPELVNTFRISGTSLGVLASGYFYSYAIMQIPAGLLSDSWGARKTVTLLGFIAAIGAILFGLAPTFGFATLSRIIVGFGVSATFVCSLKVIAEWYHGREYARTMGLFMAIGGIGWLSASTPLAILTQNFGWRAAFILTGAITVVLTILTWLIVVDSPNKKAVRAPDDTAIMPGESGRRFFAGIVSVLKDKHFRAIAIWLFFAEGTLFSFFGLWAGPYLLDTFGMTKTGAGNILSMVAAGMVFGGPFLGYLSDKIVVSRKKVLVGASICNVIIWVIMAAFYNVIPVPALYAIFFVMGVTTSSIIVIAITNVKELFPLQIAGTAIGTANLFSFFGGIVFQPLIGYILDSAGKIGDAYPPSAYRKALLVFLFINCLALIVSFFTKETLKKTA